MFRVMPAGHLKRMAALLWKHNWLRQRQPANSTVATEEDGGREGMKGVSRRVGEGRVAA